MYILSRMIRRPLEMNFDKVLAAGTLYLLMVLSLVDSKPTRLVPRHALEKFYHEMIRKPHRSDVSTETTTTSDQEPFRSYYRKQSSLKDAGQAGIKSRSLIYSGSSKKYLTVDGSKIEGTGSRYSKYAVIIVESMGFGKVRLRGEESKTYICFDRRGRLQGMVNGQRKSCIFRQYAHADHYTAFQSLSKVAGWIGVRHKGIVKKASRTKAGQNATKFLVIKL